jgi:hypothetical protein
MQKGFVSFSKYFLTLVFFLCNRLVNAQNSSQKNGQNSYVEIDTHAGAFLGFRMKAFVYSNDLFNLAVEGVWGGSIFANGAIFPTTFGGGLRSEFYLSNSGNHSWMLSPGLGFYYVPAAPYVGSGSDDLGSAIGDAFGSALEDVPTRVASLSPSVDINWLYQFQPHFGFVAGVRVGAVVLLNGRNTLDEELAGKILPDYGLYIGLRF